MRNVVSASLVVLVAAVTAFGQDCPKSNDKDFSVPSRVRTLEGQLTFHNGIRQWFELKFDLPQCGQTSIELVRGERDWKPIEILRGCRVRTTGPLDLAGTGYYSLDTYQDVQEIQSVGSCARKPRFPDYSKAEPDKTVRRYRVDMHINYDPGDHPVIFRISNGSQILHPWQAYASYFLTGGFVLYGKCGGGFVIDSVFGTPQANPGHFDAPRDPSDMAAFDPESAAASGVKDLHLGYTCVRIR